MRFVHERKRYLESLIQNQEGSAGSLNHCTLVGRPKSEMVEKEKKGQMDYILWMKEHQIPFKWGKYESTSVSFYFPRFINYFNQNELYVHVENPTIEQINQIIESSFEELLDVYEIDLSPAHIDLFAGMYLEGHKPKLSFEHLLMWLARRGVNQKKIAELAVVSPQFISDIKKGRAKPGIELLQVIMKAYPLLPWQDIISNLSW